MRSRTFSIHKIENDITTNEDVVTVEEPLEILIEQLHEGSYRKHSLSVTMRTPGDDFELAAGFLLSEGIVRDFSQIETIGRDETRPDMENVDNRVCVRLASSTYFDPDSLLRHFYTSSSCGVCGKVSLAAVDVHIPDHVESKFQVERRYLHLLPDRLKSKQHEFRKTGGLHASGLFDARGNLVRLREDIGRHNALDKLIGSYRMSEFRSLRELGLILSGRASFELIQKAAIAGIPLVASIGPPSSLAIDLAREQNVTLVGFLRENSFNQYAGDRVIHD